VHGIPDERRILEEGDIVSVDLGSDGRLVHGLRPDLPGGEGRREARALLDVTWKALGSAVGAAVRGNNVGDIGAAWSPPWRGAPTDHPGPGRARDRPGAPRGAQVPNVGRPGHGPLLREGMVLAIEPMISAGTANIRTLDDGWTVVTADGALSAHFEHTVAITADGPRILTTAGDPADALLGGA